MRDFAVKRTLGGETYVRQKGRVVVPCCLRPPNLDSLESRRESPRVLCSGTREYIMQLGGTPCHRRRYSSRQEREVLLYSGDSSRRLSRDRTIFLRLNLHAGQAAGFTPRGFSFSKIVTLGRFLFGWCEAIEPLRLFD